MDIKYFTWKERQDANEQHLKEHAENKKQEKIKTYMELFECSYEDALTYYNSNYENIRGNL